MAIVNLSGEVRNRRGKGAAREARRQGKLPGVVYVKGQDSVSINLGYKDFVTVIHTNAGANVILDLTLAGEEGVDRKAIIRDLQRDPLSGKITHVDLQHISMTEKIAIDVPIHVTGTSIGVKDYGGILEFVHRSLTIECLPTDIPNEVIVDVTALMVHDSVHVRDITVPNAKILSDPDQVVLAIVSPVVEKAAEVVEGAAAAAEPEVIGKKKEEGEAAAEGKEKDKK